jgi:hypothetical protein
VRADADPKRILELLEALGRAATGPGCLYLTGGATAVLHGWRPTTLDVDLSFSPEPPGVFGALGRLKDALDLNIELASPAHFIPELPGWRERSILIARHGRLDCFHYDPYAQALSKIERGHPRDRLDVAAMLAHGLVEPVRLRALFERVAPLFERYPAIDPDEFRAKLDEALEEPAP